MEGKKEIITIRKSLGIAEINLFINFINLSLLKNTTCRCGAIERLFSVGYKTLCPITAVWEIAPLNN